MIRYFWTMLLICIHLVHMARAEENLFYINSKWPTAEEKPAGSEPINIYEKLKCIRNCGTEYEPVCGSDGRTYPSSCLLQEASCFSLTGEITLVATGKCQENESESRQPVLDRHQREKNESESRQPTLDRHPREIWVNVFEDNSKGSLSDVLRDQALATLLKLSENDITSSASTVELESRPKTTLNLNDEAVNGILMANEYLQEEKIWSDTQCANLGWYTATKPENCITKCDQDTQCTAFHYAQGKGCSLRKCPLPVPEPEITNEQFKGYYISPGVYSLDEAIPRGYTETENVWSDDQCKQDIWVTASSIDTCKTACDQRAGCTTFHYAEGKGCSLRKCPVPIPEPTVINDAFKGYHLTALAGSDTTAEGSGSSNTNIDQSTTTSTSSDSFNYDYKATKKIWSDAQCDNMGWVGSITSGLCMKECDMRVGCNAFQYFPGSGCFLRKCPTPVPTPTEDVDGFIGYYYPSGPQTTQQPATTSKPYWLGKSMVWSDSLCENMEWLTTTSWSTCVKKCDSTPGCTAFHFANRRGCSLRECPTPVPAPTLTIKGFVGYHRVSEQEYNSVQSKKSRQGSSYSNSEHEYNSEQSKRGRQGSSYSNSDYLRWPENRVWSSDQCDDLGLLSSRSLESCEIACDQKYGCSAFHYAPGIGCFLKRCPFPLPRPEMKSSIFRGYYKPSSGSRTTYDSKSQNTKNDYYTNRSSYYNRGTSKNYYGKRVIFPTRDDNPVTWNGALDFCYDQQMKPFIPRTSTDFQLVEEVLKTLGGLRGMWLPASDTRKEGRLLWSDGSSARDVDYEWYWFDGDDLNHDRDDSHCLEFVNNGNENSLIMTPCDWERYPMICIEKY